MSKFKQFSTDSMNWIEDYFSGPSSPNFIKLWDPRDQTEVGLGTPDSMMHTIVDDFNVTSVGIRVEVDQHTIIPRMIGCMMMCNLDERGIPDALEAIYEVAQFYSDLDAHSPIARSIESGTTIKGRMTGSETRPALNYSE